MEARKQEILEDMRKYFANMSVNSGTNFKQSLRGTNYRKLAAEISKIAKANCFVGNSYSWTVWDENQTIVAAGAGRKTNRGLVRCDCSHLIGEKL